MEVQSAPQKHKDSQESKGAGHRAAAFLPKLTDSALADLRPLLFGFSMLAGAAAFLLWTTAPRLDLSIIAVVAASLSVGVSYRANMPALIFGLSFIALGASVGHTAAALRTQLVSAPQISSPTGPVMLEGWLKSIEPGQNGPRLRIKVHAVAGMPKNETPVFVRLTHGNQLEVFPGRFVRCWSVLRPPPGPEIEGDFDFQRQAYFERLGAVGYVQGKCSGGPLGAPRSLLDQLQLSLESLRRRLAVFVNTAAGPRAGGFAAALVSGDRSFMQIEDQQALRDSGLAHLLAISGLHLGLVGGLAYIIGRRLLALIEPLALRVPVQKLAAGLGIGSGALYLVISGASVSTQRAFIMLAVVLGAIIFDRVALSLRSYAIALIFVVLLQPESVLSPGFQMSFAATGALIATYEAWTARRRRSETPLRGVRLATTSILVTSVVAGAATAPYAFYHFSRVASMGLLANFAAMPVVSFASAPLAVLALFLTPIGLGEEGLRAFGYSLELVLKIAHFFADGATSSGPALKAMPGASLILISLAILFAAIGRGWGRVLPALVSGLPAIIFWYASPSLLVHWSSSGEVFVKGRDGHWGRTEFVDADGLPPLRFSRVTQSLDCQSRRSCSVDTSAGRVLLVDQLDICPERETHALILANRIAVQCENAFSWQQVSQAKALSFRFQNGEWRVSKPAPCGQRAWRSCP